MEKTGVIGINRRLHAGGCGRYEDSEVSDRDHTLLIIGSHSI